LTEVWLSIVETKEHHEHLTSRFFKRQVLDNNSVLHYLLPPKRNLHVIDKLVSDMLNLMNSPRCVLTDLRNRLFPIPLQLISDISFSIML